jgi:NAD(P)-dependent dehydrogenase (short-subunit alcohol dehydrogenase family)
MVRMDARLCGHAMHSPGGGRRVTRRKRKVCAITHRLAGHAQRTGSSRSKAVDLRMSGMHRCLDDRKSEREGDRHARFPRPLAGRHMLARRSGVIVNIASPSAAVSLDRYGLAAYGAAKAGVVALTTELAYQRAGRGVRVNVYFYIILTAGFRFLTRRMRPWPADRVNVGMWSHTNPRMRLAPAGRDGDAKVSRRLTPLRKPPVPATQPGAISRTCCRSRSAMP